jgi:hypothetical protein
MTTSRVQSASSARPSATVIGTRRSPVPGPVYDTFWRFASERQRVFLARLSGAPAPWTTDPILRGHRFTNVYRASDRVSQYLIRRVIYRDDLPNVRPEVFFRILLFKLFNRIETWEHLEKDLGPLTTKRFVFADFARSLARLQTNGHRLYSAAYIMPSTGVLGEQFKHRGHLRLVERMLAAQAADRLADAPSLCAAYEHLLSYPTIGPFLAFQFAIDVNYSEVTDFSEGEFVVAGPGARDGIRKCFVDSGGLSEEEIIRWVAERQETDPKRLGLSFPSLFGRPLQLVDVQNIFCEVSKYARAAHPEVQGLAGRTRIKQLFRAVGASHRLFFPPKWGINDAVPLALRAAAERPACGAELPILGAHAM